METVFIDEFVALSVEIRKRTLLRRLEAIEHSTYPHTSPESQHAIIDPLQIEYRQLTGQDEQQPQLDRAGLQRMKSVLGGSSKSISVK